MSIVLQLFLPLFLSIAAATNAAVINDETILGEADTKLEDELGNIRKSLATLARHVMLQQQFVEERIRSDADSGIKQVRHTFAGTRNYHADTHTNAKRVFSVHDHANNIRTVGMGEFAVVLNGVEFRTRHNDYRLFMPSRTSTDWHDTEEIPFPAVPPAVLNKPTVKEQITEMKEWFKAWRDQDHSVRDYREFFKPVLCYLEGAWTTETSGPIDEPFSSDRHFIDAKDWFDLQEKVRFTSYTGRKDNLENFSFLPRTIMNVTEDGIPKFAQWNYRILCHPLKRDVPLNRLRIIDELHPRFTSKKTYEEHSKTRAARFQLNPADSDTWTEGIYDGKWGLLDELMSEIPGKDNYPGKLTDESFDNPVYHILDSSAKLNSAYYHRSYKVNKKGAMGTEDRHRGFADENLFMAMNTQANVAGMALNGKCKWNAELRKKECSVIEQRWSYAFPLELIYLTPLNMWNPYNLKYKGEVGSELADTVTAKGRNGGNSQDRAYNGTHSKLFYHTSVEFFSGVEVEKDLADTTRTSVWAKDGEERRKVRASGTRVLFPPIEGVGTLRQRYPIAPVHGEGSSVWKELEAVKDLLLDSQTNSDMFREPICAHT